MHHGVTRGVVVIARRPKQQIEHCGRQKRRGVDGGGDRAQHTDMAGLASDTHDDAHGRAFSQRHAHSRASGRRISRMTVVEKGQRSRNCHGDYPIVLGRARLRRLIRGR